jgi:uncharacterized membrane protein
MVKTIGNPLTWGSALLGRSGKWAGDAASHIGSHERAEPVIRTLAAADIGVALRAGWDDFKAMRSDVPFIFLVYPAVAALLAATAAGAAPVHLAFPLVAGFALIGPVAGIGLYEMSKRRAAGEPSGIGVAFDAFRAGTLAPILALAAYLFVIFGFWLFVADRIHTATLGAAEPASLGAFVAATFTTGAGWAMIVWGTLAGFVLAAIVLVTSLVSFPMLVDRPVGLPVAVMTSIRVAAKNPVQVGLWGATIAALLVLGAIPAFLGLIVVIPVLGHASWHFYRMAVKF